MAMTVGADGAMVGRVGSDHFDTLETRAPEEREAALMAALPEQVAFAIAKAPYYGRVLAGVDPRPIVSREALAQLPVTRKSELIALQQDDPPFGGLAALAPGALARLFVSPGPIHDPEPHGRDPWRTARGLHAAGFRTGDVALNCFSYHFTPAGSMFETGLHAIGAAVIPAGTGNTELQAHAIAHYRPRGYVGTPDFLRVILEKADALGLKTTSIEIGHVTAGPLLPDAVAFYESRGIRVLQSYGTADVGIVAYQTPPRDGLVVNEEVVVEIVHPGTGEPVPDGEVGEVLVTPFDRTYPLIRFATGDLSAFMPGRSACGRTNRRLKGWMGRADQTAKVKGQFIYPHQIAEVARRHPEVAKLRLVIGRETGADALTLRCEPSGPAEGLAGAIAESFQGVAKLRVRVDLVEPGSLPTDGKVIEDTRMG